MAAAQQFLGGGSAPAALDEDPADDGHRCDGENAAAGKWQWRPQRKAERLAERHEGVRDGGLENGQCRSAKRDDLSETSHGRPPFKVARIRAIRERSSQFPRHRQNLEYQPMCLAQKGRRYINVVRVTPAKAPKTGIQGNR
jgi:hypothetical protein